ncbi:MAG TPA: CPBP family intramembrane glutamic endopeptidase [Candidatus Baltobacteraceae bacterium]|nr:CPBP family intramembrane glutamic endopeptidase [Candidatus Baltobacteraceae bacterium]
MEATLTTSRFSAIRRPLVVFAILFVLAQAVKITRGDTLVAAVDAALAVIFAVACRLTAHFTRSEAPEARPVERRSLVPLQLAACAIVFFASLFDVPGWRALREPIYNAAAPLAPSDFALGIANFVSYCLPIAIVLLLLRVPLNQQGLGRFRKGRRDAILGRLRTVMSVPNAIVLQALLFGLWHWNADVSGTFRRGGRLRDDKDRKYCHRVRIPSDVRFSADLPIE